MNQRSTVPHGGCQLSLGEKSSTGNARQAAHCSHKALPHYHGNHSHVTRAQPISNQHVKKLASQWNALYVQGVTHDGTAQRRYVQCKFGVDRK